MVAGLIALAGVWQRRREWRSGASAARKDMDSAVFLPILSADGHAKHHPAHHSLPRDHGGHHGDASHGSGFDGGGFGGGGHHH